MAINIPGFSLSILRQQTTVQSGLPLLVSGRFTVFGMGVPALIRVFLEGPSYDPQIRSFDTFASPFSGDYTVNVIAEKDGTFNVYSQAFPPPIMPTGPPFPDALLLLPAMAESTHPPLAVGFPFDGGVEALLPDGSRQTIPAPAMQPIEFRPLITVGAPSISIVGLGGGVPTMGALPYYPPAYPGAPPALPGFPTYAQAVVDEIQFSPPLINPGMEAIGVMAWRNTGEVPTQFDSIYYLISTDGVRYGPLQATQNVSVNPQIPSMQNIRLSTSGLPSGTYSVDVEIYDSTTGTFVTSRTLLNRLEISEIVVPVPPVIPPPVIPVTPTLDILGTPSLYLPGQIQVGDVWAGSVSLPTFATVPVFIESRLVLRDALGFEDIVAQGGRTLSPGEFLQIPVNLDTTGFSAGDYTILLRAFGPAGLMVGEFPMGILSMIAAGLPEIPTLVPAPFPVTAVPTLPTVDMFSTPSINLPTQIEIGEIWQGNITIPTKVPSALQAFPSLPSFPADIGLKLQTPSGQMFDVGSWRPSFTPGQNINLPVNFDTSMLSEQGINNLVMEISDIQGNPLFSNAISTLRSMLPEIPGLPGLPELPGIPLPSKFSTCIVQMGAQTVQVGESVTVPFTFVHVGKEEIVVLRAAVGDARAVYLGGFDEIWHQDKTVTVPGHAIPTVIRESISVNIRPKWPINMAKIYSVYAKVNGGIPKAISPVIPNIINVVYAPEVAELPGADIKDFNINLLTLGPFDPGSVGSFTATCQYKGRAQGGAIKIELGTGVAPTFFSKFRLMPEIAVSFSESQDWRDFSFRGNFTIPTTAEKGQKYNLRGKIETFFDPTDESETDWGVIEITAAPSIPSSEFSRVEVALGYTVVHTGDVLQVPVNYAHVGQAETVRLYLALGEAYTTLGFDEMADGMVNISVPDDSVIRTRQATVSIAIPSLKPGSYDLYAKINGEQSRPLLSNIFVAAEAPLPSSEFSNVIVLYPTTPVRIGGTLDLEVTFIHVGEGESEWLHAAIGNDGLFGFDEKLYNRRAVTVPGEANAVYHREPISIPITTAIKPGTYDIYAKIGSRQTPVTRDVIRIIS